MSIISSTHTTERGKPAVWEDYEPSINKDGGSVTIVTKPDGTKPRAAAFGDKGSWRGHHALVPVEVGYFIIHVHATDGVMNSASVFRVDETATTDVDGEEFSATITMTKVASFLGKWIEPLEPMLDNAIEVAVRKATAYNPREVTYVDESALQEDNVQRTQREADEARQDVERAKLRLDKARRDLSMARTRARMAVANARAEKASSEAMPRLLPRLNTLRDKLSVLNLLCPDSDVFIPGITVHSSYFTFSDHGCMGYTEKNILFVEERIQLLANDLIKKLEAQIARAMFQPLFEMYIPYVKELGMTLGFETWAANLYTSATPDKVSIPYSTDGLAILTSHLNDGEEYGQELPDGRHSFTDSPELANMRATTQCLRAVFGTKN